MEPGVEATTIIFSITSRLAPPCAIKPKLVVMNDIYGLVCAIAMAILSRIAPQDILF